MNFLLKILFIFLSFLIVHGTNIETVPILSNAPANYIQNNYQKVVLTSQNLSQDVIIKNHSGDSQNYTFNENCACGANPQKLLLVSTKPLIARGNIHNISTDLNSEISIRAP